MPAMVHVLPRFVKAPSNAAALPFAHQVVALRGNPVMEPDFSVALIALLSAMPSMRSVDCTLVSTVCASPLHPSCWA